jgi:hypothetical protein
MQLRAFKARPKKSDFVTNLKKFDKVDFVMYTYVVVFFMNFIKPFR